MNQQIEKQQRQRQQQQRIKKPIYRERESCMVFVTGKKEEEENYAMYICTKLISK